MMRLAEVLTQQENARLAFFQDARRYWASHLYRELRAEYDDVARDRGSPSTLREAVAVVQELPTHSWFGWAERNVQKLKWRNVSDAVDRHSAELGIGTPAAPGGTSTVELRPELELPGWYTDIDIHCQPGGVWSADANALVYEAGASILHLGRNDRLELHESFVEGFFPRLRTGRIVDLGCGFGKSTRPIARRFPDAEVIGVDLAASVLRLGARRASEEGLRLRFLQGDAADVPLDSGSCSVVTGTMLLHELPEAVLVAVIKETARLLEPDGAARFLEFGRTGDLFHDACMQEHAWRNNEPFMPQLMDYPVDQLLRSVGLRNVRWVPFDAGAGGSAAGDEWHFPWAVLCAEKES